MLRLKVTHYQLPNADICTFVLFFCLVSSNGYLSLCSLCLALFFSVADWKNKLVTITSYETKHLILMALSSPKSHVHSSLRLHLPISFSSNNGLPARAAETMTGRAQTLYCLLSSLLSRGIQKISLSDCCRPSCSGPGQSVFGIIPSWMKGSLRLRGSNEWQLQCIWYYAMQWTGSLSEGLMCFCTQT